MVGVSLVEGLTQSGTFDARALISESLYSDYIRDKHKENYGYCGWNIRGSLNDQLTQKGKHVPPDIIAVLDQRMREIASRSEAHCPWELKIAGLLRTAGWGFELPSRSSYTRNGIWCGPRYFGNHPSATAAWRRFCTTGAPAKIGKSLTLVDLDDQDVTTPWPLEFVQSEAWSDWHQHAYRGFLGAGLIWGFFILWYNAPALAAPTLVFLANIGLNTWLLNMQGRYILTLESFVVFQTAMGLHFLIRYGRELRTKLASANPTCSTVIGSEPAKGATGDLRAA
jgi:hypothetical protein